MRCPTCGARDRREHPSTGDGGEVAKLCEDRWHRQSKEGRDTYDKAKRMMSARRRRDDEGR